MKILARYISALFLRNFILSVIGLTFLFLFQSLLGQLLDTKYTTDQIVIYNLLGLGQIFVQMIPPSVLMATVLTLSGMSRTNELIAIHSIGIGLKEIMTIVFSLALIISSFSLVLQDRILPPLFKKRLTYYWREMRQRQDFFLDVKKDKIWYRSKNLIFNLKTFDPKQKTIYGMSVYKFDQDFRLSEVLEAKKANFSNQGWLLIDGSTTTFQGVDDLPHTRKFKERALQIIETPQDFQEIEKEVEGLQLKELYRYIGRTREAGVDTKSYEVKFHARLSMSFIPLVMAFLALPFSIRRRREGGLAKDLGICLIITFLYWVSYSLGLSLGSNGALPPWLAAWLPSAVFVALTGLFMALRREA